VRERSEKSKKRNLATKGERKREKSKEKKRHKESERDRETSRHRKIGIDIGKLVNLDYTCLFTILDTSSECDIRIIQMSSGVF
jgi:hypothetical protein